MIAKWCSVPLSHSVWQRNSFLANDNIHGVANNNQGMYDAIIQLGILVRNTWIDNEGEHRNSKVSLAPFYLVRWQINIAVRYQSRNVPSQISSAADTKVFASNANSHMLGPCKHIQCNVLSPLNATTVAHKAWRHIPFISLPESVMYMNQT